MSAIDDLKSTLSAIPGGSAIAGAIDDAIAYVTAAAKAGAEQAIPDIQAKVEATVQPYVIVALALGAGGLLFGFSAHLATRRALAARGSS